MKYEFTVSVDCLGRSIDRQSFWRAIFARVFFQSFFQVNFFVVVAVLCCCIFFVSIILLTVFFVFCLCKLHCLELSFIPNYT
jgi:hypothetical protein